MGTENLKPLDELRNLDQQIEVVNDLAGLKPIFFRLEEIAKGNVNDFDVQLAVGDIKQHLVNRGTKLKELKEAAKEMKDTRREAPAAPIFAPPPVQPPLPMATPPVPPLVPPPGPIAAPPPGPVAAPPVPPPLPPLPPPTVQMAAPPTIPAIPVATPPLSPPQGPWATTENAPLPGPPPQMAPPAPPPIGTRPVQLPPKPVLKTAPKPAAKPAAKPPASSSHWKRSLLLGGVIGVLLVAAVAVGVVVHKRHLSAAANAAIQVQIATTPPGASVRVNGEPQCTSNCSVGLAPGNYQITAFLDGYEPAASGIAVAAGQPVSVNLTLEPQAQSLRIITDLDRGTVTIDSDPPADLQEGQFVLDRVQPGTHIVKVTGKGGEATFSFEIADAKQPTISGPVVAHNLDAVLVASLGSRARVVTSTGPMKLAVNGQPEADTNPAGVDLTNFQPGVDELVIGEGKDQHSVKENFGPAPMLTAFINSDLNAGTLVVSTGVDDVRVFVNNREYPRHTRRGVVRIQTIGPVSVRVTKDGFDTPPVQTAEVKRGAETRLDFKLNPLPQFATLQVAGGTPGAEVLVDQRSVGTIGPDGSFNNGTVAPGDHTVEIRRDGYVSHQLPRSFRAGETVAIFGADAVLAAIPPPPAPVAKKIEPPAPRKQAPPSPKAGTMADWENPEAWKAENGTWLHQGRGFIPYKLTPKGVFTFTVELVKGGSIFRGGRVRWCVNYIDDKNYALYEMDNKNFWAKVVIKGKTFERTHTQLKDLEKQKAFTIQIDVTPEHIVHKMFTGGDWINLDSWAETGRNFSDGKFGFLIQGNDEIGLTDFKFQPK